MIIVDTASDFRIRLAEKAVNELEKALNSVKVQKRKELVSAARSLGSEIQVVKYSYMPPEEIVKLENFKKIVEVSESIKGAIEKAERDFQWKQTYYWLDYLTSLPNLMGRGEIERAYEAIRYFSGEITSRTEMGSLWLCVVDCGFRMEVVTNSEAFKPGRYAVVSYLPPKQFGKVISDGMFVDASLNKKGELELEEIRSISASLGEVEAVVLSLIR